MLDSDDVFAKRSAVCECCVALGDVGEWADAVDDEPRRAGVHLRGELAKEGAVGLSFADRPLPRFRLCGHELVAAALSAGLS